EEVALEYDERRSRGTRGRARSDQRRHAGESHAGGLPEDRPGRQNRKPADREMPPARRAASKARPVPNTAEVNGSRRRERKREPESVVGFGDHLPAFLARPTPLAARPATEGS